MNKTKGKEKKEYILNTCKELFYAHGYISTSSRMISKEGNINLGLLNYYFNGKAEIGKIVYFDLRNHFDSLITQNEPNLSEIDLFLISSALELSLCLKNPNYGRFFVEIINEDAVNKRMFDFITTTFDKIAIHKDESYPELPAISILAIKRSLVRHSLLEPNKKEAETYIKYYLQQQLQYLGMNISRSMYYIDILKNYYVDVALNLTPIFVKIG